MPDADPETLRLRPSPKRWIVVLVISLAFVVGGLFLPESDPTAFWAIKVPAVGLFGLAALVSLAQFLPGVNELVIGPQSFTMRALGRSHEIGWREIEGEFRVVDLLGLDNTRISSSWFLGAGGQRMVGFDMTPPRGDGALAKWNKAKFGLHGALSDSYGMTHQALADLMNEHLGRWRATQPWSR